MINSLKTASRRRGAKATRDVVHFRGISVGETIRGRIAILFCGKPAATYGDFDTAAPRHRADAEIDVDSFAI